MWCWESILATVRTEIDCLLEERLLGEDVRLSRLRVQNARA